MIHEEPVVWLATCLQVAEWALETGQNADVIVPIPEDLADGASSTSREQ